MRELPPLPGDSTSAATAINDRGQVVGISGECDIAVGQLSARHSVLWEKDTVINIGDLGGDAWHTPMDINAAGDVVGFSNPRGVVGIDFAPHAFLWTRAGGIRDLGIFRVGTIEGRLLTSRSYEHAAAIGKPHRPLPVGGQALVAAGCRWCA
jgi:probable HAF family extracellular repeat protein